MSEDAPKEQVFGEGSRMNPTQKSLFEQMQINELEIVRRKALLGFTDRDAELLLACRPLIQDDLPALINAFYDYQTSVNEIAVIIGDSDSLQRLKSAMLGYTEALFCGVYAEDYVNNRLRIGLVHKRIGVGPKYYLSAMHLLKRLLMDSLKRQLAGLDSCTDTMLALDKLLHFDMEFVFDTYIGSLLSEIELAKDRVVEHALKLEQKVAERTRELEELSRRDGLTGLFNQRVFVESLGSELARARRTHQSLTLLYLDLDGFKQINDTRGHLAGDEVLRQVGAEIAAQCRANDIACRHGGDEFCILLPATEADGGMEFGHRLQAALAQLAGIPPVSIGVVQAGPEQWPNLEKLVDAADRAMYQAKSRGGEIHTGTLDDAG